MISTVSSSAALKEWAISAAALSQGRQILLLRKGGLHDEDGAFTLEHREFFLMPTWFHQERGLVKEAHQELWQQAPREDDETAKVVYLRHFARVERVWQLREDAEAALAGAAHIYSRAYLDLRFAYQEALVEVGSAPPVGASPAGLGLQIVGRVGSAARRASCARAE